jgi:hypothetical protein
VSAGAAEDHLKGEARPPSGPIVLGEIDVETVTGTPPQSRRKSSARAIVEGTATADRVERADA